MHPALTTPLATAAALPLIAMAHGAKPLAAINASAHWLDQTAGATPGWEMALPRSAVAAIFAAMALGMAAGTVRK